MYTSLGILIGVGERLIGEWNIEFSIQSFKRDFGHLKFRASKKKWPLIRADLAESVQLTKWPYGRNR